MGNATPSVAWAPVIDDLTDPVMVSDAMLSIVLDGKRTIICPLGFAIWLDNACSRTLFLEKLNLFTLNFSESGTKKPLDRTSDELFDDIIYYAPKN